MNFKAVTFDLDGTLLDTLEDIATTMNSVLTEHGYPVHVLDAYRYFVGDGVGMLVRRAVPRDRRDKDNTEKLVEEFRSKYRRNWNLGTRPYDGVAEALNGLVARDIRLAVLSNKPHESTVHCVSELLPDWTFDIVLGERDETPRKPDPAGALQIAGFLGFNPEEILYVGDTGVDMKTAVAAGMYPVGALWGFRSGVELRNSGARVLIERPQEILDLVGYESKDDQSA